MNLKDINPKGRFSDRVQNYVKYRPGYPTEILNYLHNNIRFSSNSTIADIGSGTGISAKLFLDNENVVYGIEPNPEMRQAAEEILSTYSNFHSINASSENTKLQSESIDIIVAAQAFHWFDPKPTKEEFMRILKPNGAVVILANRRKKSSDKFMNGYMDIVAKYGERLNLKTDSQAIPDFFYPNTIHKEIFDNPYIYDFDRLKGELASYSYMPNEQDSRYKPMIADLEVLFEKFSSGGNVTFEYETVMYYCQMK